MTRATPLIQDFEPQEREDPTSMHLDDEDFEDDDESDRLGTLNWEDSLKALTQFASKATQAAATWA